ncbi:hypothetical protein BOX15_Mlig023744g1, partial [Macrostomum lignano]
QLSWLRWLSWTSACTAASPTAISWTFVCVAHRFSDSHPCERRQRPVGEQDPAAAVSKSKLSDGLLEQLRQADSRKSAEPAKPHRLRQPGQERKERQLALMKLRLSAVGDKSVPQADRVYFMVQPDIQKQQHQPVPVFFSRHWPVGKATDSLAARLGVPPVRKLQQQQSTADQRLSLLPLAVEDPNSMLGAPLPAGDSLATCLQRGDFAEGDRLLLTYWPSAPDF